VKDFMTFAGGALLGAAIGAGIVMFTTPQSGPQTRSSISSRFRSIMDEARSATKQREQELWSEFDVRVKAPAELSGNTAAASTIDM
jgi:gas vesicle protein